MKRIILASTSPRRREILQMLKIPFEVCPPKFSESSDSTLTPEQEALHFAREKALSLKEDFPDALIIGSDTIVELGGKKLGKPQNSSEAAEMLRSLSGKTHRVLTGLAVVDAETGDFQDSLSIASVKMRPFSESEIADYVASREPMDKAGAYAVQGLGGKLIAAVEGDFYTVVGLPLKDLARILTQFGVSTNIPPDPKI